MTEFTTDEIIELHVSFRNNFNQELPVTSDLPLISPDISYLPTISRHVGEKVRMDLQRKQNLPSNKLATLMAKFDEMKTSGRMMPTATLAVGTMEGRNRAGSCSLSQVE